MGTNAKQGLLSPIPILSYYANFLGVVIRVIARRARRLVRDLVNTGIARMYAASSAIHALKLPLPNANSMEGFNQSAVCLCVPNASLKRRVFNLLLWQIKSLNYLIHWIAFMQCQVER